MKISDTSDSLNEAEFLNKLFDQSNHDRVEAEHDFPLVDVSANLAAELYAIPEADLNREPANKLFAFRAWPKWAGMAAGLLIAVVLLQIYDQRQTIKQLEQAQHDLATALHYLREANQITRVQMLNTLNSNMQKASIVPIVEIGRAIARPPMPALEPETEQLKRTL